MSATRPSTSPPTTSPPTTSPPTTSPPTTLPTTTLPPTRASCLRPPRRVRRAFTLLEVVVVLIVLATTGGLMFQSVSGTTGLLQTTVAKGYQEQVITAELRYDNIHGAYTADPTQLTGLTRDVTVVSGPVTGPGQVSIAVGTSSGKLGVASTNGGGVCTIQQVDTVLNGATRTVVTPAASASCIGTNALAGGQ